MVTGKSIAPLFVPFTFRNNKGTTTRSRAINKKARKSEKHPLLYRYLLRRLPLQPEDVHVREGEGTQLRQDMGLRPMLASDTDRDRGADIG